MRIFLAGAAGVVGRQLVPMLVAGGHTVLGTTRDPGRTADLRAAGAEPVVLDALDPAAVRRAVVEAGPEVVVHQLTALTGLIDLRRFDRTFAATNRLRTAGTDHLLAAAREAGARLLVAQSFGGWPAERTGGPVKTEDDPFDPATAAPRTLAALRHLERVVTGSDRPAGIVLRYGLFYGPGTSLAADSEMTELVRKRRFPVVGAGTGVWSFCHVTDAARATVAAIERGTPGTYAIADDEPAPVREWLPALASALGARPPMRVPAWVARPMIGRQGMTMMTSMRGVSNAKARRELDWAPTWSSWREGFVSGL